MVRLCSLVLCALPLAAAVRADLARFGTARNWPGVEWDEPREFSEIRVSTAGPVDPSRVTPEYWVSSWPPPEGRGGWTLTDSPFNGEWREIRATREARPGLLVFRFLPLTAEENPNAKNRQGPAPSFRRTLKVRLRFAAPAPPLVKALHIYGSSGLASREVLIETGCEKKPAAPVALDIYNGRILRAVEEGRKLRATVEYTDHEPDSNDRTVISVRSGEFRFGVAMDDLLRHKGIYVRDAGIFVGDASARYGFQNYLGSGRLRPGRDILSLAGKQPEQSLERAMAEVPPLAMTQRNGRHRLRYVPVGFFGNREKYGVDFNGNLFISKHGTKLFQDELANMLWEGDMIAFRFGTGAEPDFRERERAASQRVLEDDLPVVITQWRHEGVHYRAETFATLLDAPLDPWKNRGDEPSVLLTRVTARNPGAGPADAVLWLNVAPEEKLELRRGLLTGERGFRGALRTSRGAFAMARHGARWQGTLGSGEIVVFEFRTTLRTLTDEAVMRRVADVDHDAARQAVVAWWREAVSQGMRLDVPDEYFNRFHKSALQHILLSVQRDVSTGLYMAPCGTYDYNMFLNETNMQVRLLDMRGLHRLARTFLEPLVALQGSKPFPGRFRDTKAIFHGIRVDADHDYTHSGYNLNHGWTLWTLAEHYFFTRDREWLRAKLPAILKGADWIATERKATMVKGAREYGLLPAGQLEDNEEFHHWYAVNAYAYKGLRAAAKAVADIDPAEGRRLSGEADSYRRDIRAAAMRSMEASPVVPLLDGTWVPTVPPRTGIHGREFGWIRNILYGAHALVDGGVFDLDEPVTSWILRDLEDNLFMAAMSFSVAEHDWFSRGGIALQPNLVNTAITYLRRDEAPQALRPFYNTFAASYYPDVNMFTEWVPSFGRSGGPFFKTSDEACFLTWLRLFLLREEENALYLLSGAPRRWFRPGEHIEVSGAATFFGTVGFRVESSESGIEARVDLPPGVSGKQVWLRLRHPGGKTPARVEVNGGVSRMEREMVAIPAAPGRVHVRVSF